jgi:hypothetical protein
LESYLDADLLRLKGVAMAMPSHMIYKEAAEGEPANYQVTPL